MSFYHKRNSTGSSRTKNYSRFLFNLKTIITTCLLIGQLSYSNEISKPALESLEQNNELVTDFYETSKLSNGKQMGLFENGPNSNVAGNFIDWQTFRNRDQPSLAEIKQLEEARAFVNNLQTLDAILYGPEHFDLRGSPQSAPSPLVHGGQPRKRRTIISVGSQGGNLNKLLLNPNQVMERLNAIGSLNSLLDDGNAGSLGRAYKPKTMSTARGFGKK